MSKVLSYPPNTFCWVDLTTIDQPKAKDFYRAIFDWEAEDVPVQADIYYTMMRKAGLDVAAISPQPQMMREAGLSSTWNSYINVKDVTASTALAQELGAHLLAEPMEVMDQGRMSIIADPAGAVVMLWQAKKQIGAGVVNEPDSFIWNELLTDDIEGSTEFYTKLFGWTHSSAKMPDGRDYHRFENNGRGVGAMLEMKGLPPAWMVYFAVADLAKSIEQIEELGGQKHMGPMTIPGTGSFAFMQDMVGAHFYIMQMDREPSPLPAA